MGNGSDRQMAAVQRGSGTPLGRRLSAGTPDVAFLVEGDGSIRKGVEAFLPLLPGLPGGRILHAILRAVMNRWRTWHTG